MPDLEAQKQEHRYFKNQLIRLREQYFSGQVAVPAKVLNFMRDWFLEHVLETDRKYGEFFLDRPLVGKKGIR